MKIEVTNHRIHNVPPTVISGFYVQKFSRYGPHPGYNRVIRRAYPILSRIPLVNMFLLKDESSWDWVRPATLIIIGADGSWIKAVEMRTNQAALDEKEAMEAKLDQFLSNIQKDDT